MWLRGSMAVMLTVLTGCFAPRTPTGVVCDPLAPVCPGGQQCVRQGGAYECSEGEGDPMPDANLDDDGDGIANAADLCPAVADPAQDNEDGDRFGDACDPCPPIADDDPADRDADGVADACDPDPAHPGDHIVRFDGFAHSLDGWTATGTWTLTASGAAAGVPNGETATLTMPSPAGRATIRAAFRVDALNGTFSYSGAGTIDQAGANAGILCHAFRSGTGANRLGLVDVAGGILLDTSAMPFASGEQYVVALTRTDGPYQCSGVHDANESTSEATYTPTAAQPAIGLDVRAAAVTFEWVLVVAGS